LKNSL
jgi:hypothetical protein